ncbi:nuclease-related domain-containing protein [Streptomyces sp. NPDC052179]|uniref:nuclease-related domain-containing protein n=1 Tax=Streptomyces sp. NPDC052179 TaxID=3155680 RepID=UPI00342FE693
MTLFAVLAVAAAVAWYFQGQQRPGAGSSAAAEARRLRTPLVRLADLVGIETAAGSRARRLDAGAVGEKATAALLRSLTQQGWVVLHDRALPYGRANVDHLLISPTGKVFVLDSKWWSGRFFVYTRNGRLWHGQIDVDDRLDGLRYESCTVATVLGIPVVPVVVMHGAPMNQVSLTVGNIRIVPAALVTASLRGTSRHPGHRLSQAAVAARAKRLLPSYGGKG